MHNMKIEINEQQPLNEIIAQLEKLGFTKLSKTKFKPHYVIATPDGYYSVRKASAICNTTLDELKKLTWMNH